MPNLPDDVNSWGRSACYPQGNFYPLSDGISTHCHLITNSDFRLCPACLPRSQAGFCVCTLCAVSVRAEPTFERLRYSFGGDRPSQTTRLALSPGRFHGSGLEPQQTKGGIPTSAPRTLTSALLRFPPILYVICRDPVSGCSKAPWGLSV